METKQTRWQRYRLQGKLRKLKVRYDSQARTMFLPFGANIDEKERLAITRLTTVHGYVIQTEIPQ